MVRVKERKEQEIGRFAELMREAMSKQNMDITALSSEIGTTYEHIRKLTLSMAFPSRLMLEKICKVLHMNLKEAEQFVVADRLKHKYGDIPEVLAGKNPKFEEVVERILPKMTDEQYRLYARIGRAILKNEG